MHGWNQAKVNRSNRLRVVAQKRPPVLGGRMSPSDHILGYRQLGEIKPKLKQFTMDAGSAPQWVFPAHSSDEIAELAINPRPRGSLSRFPAPVTPEARPMPPQNRRRLNDLGHTEQARPQPGHPHQQRAVATPQRQTRRSPPQSDIKSMTEKQDPRPPRPRPCKRRAPPRRRRASRGCGSGFPATRARR